METDTVAAEAVPQPESEQPQQEATEQQGDAAAEQAQDAGVASVEAAPAAAPPNPQLEKYHEQWKEVQAAPTDFTAWTNLIAAAEKLDELDKLVTVYDTFLASWPLCYGYWKKHADAEQRHGSSERAIAVYERGVAATPYSIDIWVHYSNFQKAVVGATPESIRSIYERALAAVGTDYLSHSIWDKYLAFEEEQGSGKAVLTSLYSRVLGVPLRDLDKYYNALRTIVHSVQVQEIMTDEEATAFRSQLEAEKKAAADAATKAAAEKAAEAGAVKTEEGAPADGMAVDAVKAEESAPGASEAEPAAEVKAEPTPMDASGPAVVEPEPVTDDEVKARWMVPRDELYQKSKVELDSRRHFEEGIKRAYFHVKPLDAAQLTNWLKYLDYMESKGDANASIILYERCLVPCASYPEFWERYVRWLEKHGYKDEAAAALQRATITFCRMRPDIHLFAMHYDERNGNVDSARARYKVVLGELAPKLISATVAAANFERRQGNREAACELYESLIKEEQGKDDNNSKSTLAFLSMQYANFLRLAFKDYGKGRQVLQDALATAPHLKQLWEAAIFYEEACASPDMVKVVLELCTRASSPSSASAEASKPNAQLPEKDREDFSLRAVEFADTHGSPADLLAAEQHHAAHFMLPSNVAVEGRKRHADAMAAAEASRPNKSARTDGAAAAPAHGSSMPSPPSHAQGGGYYPPGGRQPPPAYPGYYGGYPPAPAYPGAYPAPAYPPAPYPAYGSYGY